MCQKFHDVRHNWTLISLLFNMLYHEFPKTFGFPFYNYFSPKLPLTYGLYLTYSTMITLAVIKPRFLQFHPKFGNLGFQFHCQGFGGLSESQNSIPPKPLLRVGEACISFGAIGVCLQLPSHQISHVASHPICAQKISIFWLVLCHYVSYVAAVAVEILQSGVMLQASRQLWRPSSTLLSSRLGRRTVLGISCSSSNFLLHSSGESTCISRITIPPHSGWAQERPSAVPWIIRCLFFLHIFMGFWNFFFNLEYRITNR